MTTQINSIQQAKADKLERVGHWSKRPLLLTALAMLDTLTVLFGFWLAYLVRFELSLEWFYQHEVAPTAFYRQFVFFLTPVWILVFAIFGLYNFKNIFAGTQEYISVFNASTLGIVLVIIFSFLEPEIQLARAWVILSWLTVMSSVAMGRFVFRRIIHGIRIRGGLMTNVLMIGANEEGVAVAQQLNNNPKAGVKIVGFVDNYLKTDKEPKTNISVLGGIDVVVEMVKKHDVHEVIIASTALARRQLLNLIEVLHDQNIQARLSSGLYELLTTGVEVQEIGNVPLLTVNKIRLTGSELFLKRALDFVGAIVALTLFLPFMIIIGIAVKLDSRGPIFYRRRVVGVGGKQFDAFKFRTMSVDADLRLARDKDLRKEFEQNFKLKDDPRVTRVGQFLRKTSLDELPQLFNVVLGQMSLVGPRMITAPERSYYGKWHMNLFTVKPGITGLWQVSGRSDVSYNERVMLDMQYIRNYSIWVDIYILWQTIPAVLKSRGAY